MLLLYMSSVFCGQKKGTPLKDTWYGVSLFFITCKKIETLYHVPIYR